VRAQRRMAAGLVLAILGGAGAVTAAWAQPAGANVRPANTKAIAPNPKALARGLVLNAAQRQYLLQLYAADRHISRIDIAPLTPRSALAAQLLANGTDWAIIRFEPAAGAPQAAAIKFQDGAGAGVFTRTRGGSWRIAGLGGEPLGCGIRLPVPVRHLWRLTSCATPSRTAPGVIQGASSTDQLADLAEDQVGVSDNPAELNFSGLDCNPYTAMVTGTSTTSCGTDGRFNIKDASELWCADFTKWVWEQAGVTSDLSTLTAAAASFYTWGKDHGESLPEDPANPQVGDAVVFYPDTTPNGSFADHVGIVSAVNPDGSINLVNGDFLGTKNISVQANNNISNLQQWANSNWQANHIVNGQQVNEDWIFVSPQLPTANRSVAAAVDKFGNEYVFWENASNGGLEETSWNGSSWSGAHGIAGMGQLGSAPAVAVGPQSSGGDAYQYVFWRGMDGNLWEAWWNGSWNGPKDLGDGPLGSAPAVGVDGAGNEYVFWESAGTGRGLEETEWNGSSWTAAHGIPGIGPLASSPSVAVTSGGDQYVFWTGANGDLWQGWWNGSSWNGPKDLGDGPLGSPPGAGVDGSGNQYVFWTGISGDLTEAWWNGSSWNGPKDLGDGPLASAPAVAVDSAGDQFTWWKGTNADLWQAWWNGSSWNGPKDLGDGPIG
jgi:hypothetical protein